MNTYDFSKLFDVGYPWTREELDLEALYKAIKKEPDSVALGRRFIRWIKALFDYTESLFPRAIDDGTALTNATDLWYVRCHKFLVESRIAQVAETHPSLDLRIGRILLSAKNALSFFLGEVENASAEDMDALSTYQKEIGEEASEVFQMIAEAEAQEQEGDD